MMQAEIVMVQEFPVEGVLRLRVDTFREPGELGYEKHHVQVPVIPEGGYSGQVDGMGSPVDQEDYDKWLAELPHVWQNNPCLCQFFLVPLGTHPLKIQEVVQAHTQRVKDALPVDIKTAPGLESLESIERGLNNHLSLLRINRMKSKPRSIKGRDAVSPRHKLLGVRATE